MRLGAERQLRAWRLSAPPPQARPLHVVPSVRLATVQPERPRRFSTLAIQARGPRRPRTTPAHIQARYRLNTVSRRIRCMHSICITTTLLPLPLRAVKKVCVTVFDVMHRKYELVLTSLLEMETLKNLAQLNGNVNKINQKGQGNKVTGSGHMNFVRQTSTDGWLSNLIKKL